MEDRHEPNIRPRYTFIVRFWSETAPPAPAQWRGSVEHVPTGERMYFVRLADLADWLAFHLHEPGPTNSSAQLPDQAQGG